MMSCPVEASMSSEHIWLLGSSYSTTRRLSLRSIALCFSCLPHLFSARFHLYYYRVANHSLGPIPIIGVVRIW